MNRRAPLATASASVASPRRQRGATLVVVLVLLLVMTLLGLASLRGTLLEERMTANLLDRSIGFQNAEAALREAEMLVMGNPTVPNAGCAAGICARPVATARERWLDAGFNGWVTSTAISAADAANRPQYFVEFMGQFTDTDDVGLGRSANENQYGTSGGVSVRRFFRVTARSRNPASNDRSFIILQSTIAVR